LESAFFGVKPELILKGGLIASANMGDPNASIPTPQPTFYRPQFAAHGRARYSTSVTFVSDAALREGTLSHLQLGKRLSSVRNTRHVSKRNLLRNDALPKIEVDSRDVLKSKPTVVNCAANRQQACQWRRGTSFSRPSFRADAMRLIHGPAPASQTNLPRIALKADRMRLAKRRWRGFAEDGNEFGFDLEFPLRDGSCFFNSDTHAYVIEQLPEPVIDIICPQEPSAAARLGWVLGNLHFPIEAHRSNPNLR
jgi:hypothetical protein